RGQQRDAGKRWIESLFLVGGAFGGAWRRLGVGRVPSSHRRGVRPGSNRTRGATARRRSRHIRRAAGQFPRRPRRRRRAAHPRAPTRRAGTGSARRVTIADPASFIRANTEIASPPLVPEIRLHLASEVTPLWQMTERELDRHNLPPPYWAFAWPGGQALARYLLDHPDA